MPTIASAIQQFQAYLQRRHYSPHTLESYTLDLQVFFAGSDEPLERISFREVDRFIDAQHQQGLSPATINRRLYALKHFFDFLNDQQLVGTTPVKPSHVLRRSRALPRALSQEQLDLCLPRSSTPWIKPSFC